MPTSAPSIVATAGLVIAAVALHVLKTRDDRRIKRILGENYAVLDGEELEMAKQLLRSGHQELLCQWKQPGANDKLKRELVRAAFKHVSSAAAAVQSQHLAVLKPPAPRQCDAVVTSHGDARPDPYAWLRDDERESPEVLAHLRSENEYTQRALAGTKALQEDLCQEMRARIQEADQTSEVRRGSYYYYTRTREGEQYRVHCRRAVAPEATGPETEASSMDSRMPEEVLLDEDAEARAHAYYSVAYVAVSDDASLLAYAEDSVGSEKYDIRVVALGQADEPRRSALDGRISGTSGEVVWAADNATIFYVLLDKTLRPYKVMRHHIHKSIEEAECVYEELDERYVVGIGRSHDRGVLFISVSASMQNEEYVLLADQPGGTFRVLAPRQDNVDYSADRWHDSWIFTRRTEGTPNSELYVAPLGDFASRRLLLPHADTAKLEDVAVFDSHLVLVVRRDGLQECRIYTLPESKRGEEIVLDAYTTVAFDDEVYTVELAAQGDFESGVVRLCYSSLARPRSWLARNMRTGAQAVRKVAPVLGGFEQSMYVTRRLWAESHDGVKVPISVVYHKERYSPGVGGPLHLYVYGAYEICIDPDFSSNRLSLLNRGAAFAIAHVRGGGEMGRLWYENGKFLKKRNTFLDTVAAAEHLVASGWTVPGAMTLEGRSAGGMTVGAVANMRPDLFQGIVMGVPFVDCLTTMLDDSIPLTVLEYEEWGNPNDEEYYHYMKAYSPIDNITAQKYPAILVTAGLHDPRVGYWEPAKYAATLRDRTRMDALSNPVLLKTDLGAGHFSMSGRFDKLKEVALDYAFILRQLGLHG